MNFKEKLILFFNPSFIPILIELICIFAKQNRIYSEQFTFNIIIINNLKEYQMAKVLIIGAGGVGSVVTHNVRQYRKFLVKLF